MPDRRQHRGAHPQDADLFGARHLPGLRAALADLHWLLDRGYVERSALKLVGDRHGLRQRQRTALLRCACTAAQARARREREVGPRALRRGRLWIDAYNVLITVEAALAGGVLLLGRDRCLRDLASLHGSFRRVQETLPALELLGAALAAWGVSEAAWYLDRPVSNSGRLAARMRELGAARGWPWHVHIVKSPDAVLRRTPDVAATADSAILDRCGAWFNLARRVVASRVPSAAPLDLRRRVPVHRSAE